jgi:hypothetical protein
MYAQAISRTPIYADDIPAICETIGVEQTYTVTQTIHTMLVGGLTVPEIIRMYTGNLGLLSA